MKNQQRSNVVCRFIRSTILPAALLLTSMVSAAQAQNSATAQNPEKPAVSEPQFAKIVPIDPEKSGDSIPIAAKPEIRTDRFSAAPGSTAAAKNPFADASKAEPLTPIRQSSGSDWQVAFAPYLYMTGMTGTVGARGETIEVDMDFSDVIENLNLGLMGALEARKGRFVLVNDLMWIKLGEERDTPGQLFSSVKVGVNMFIWDPEAGYRLYEGTGGSFDVLGGIRLMSIENNVNLRAGILPARDVSERKTWATPVIGAHGTLNLSPKFFLATKFDIGGGLGADFTGQFYGGGGYRITPKIALVGGYRYMKTKYDSEAGFLFDTTMNGILMGAKFTF